MKCQDLDWILSEEKPALRHLADDVVRAAREQFPHTVGAREFAAFFNALVESLLWGRPHWPIQRFLTDPDGTAWLIERACEVASGYDRCATSRMLRDVVRPLWAECLAREAEGWHRPVAWDLRPTRSAGASSLGAPFLCEVAR